MSELAFNINGEPFEVPANASGWRVRKMRAKGSPEVVYGREGQPLVLPIEAEIDDLRAEVDTTGRYRLDLVDQNNKPIAGAPSGYVQINVDDRTGGDERASLAAVVARHGERQHRDRGDADERRDREVGRRSVPADDGGGRHAAARRRRRRPAGAPWHGRVPSDDEDDEDEDDDEDDQAPAAPGFDLNALVAQIVPMLVDGLASGKLKMPELGAMLDWRKAAPKAEAAEAATATSTDGAGDDAGAASSRAAAARSGDDGRTSSRSSRRSRRTRPRSSREVATELAPGRAARVVRRAAASSACPTRSRRSAVSSPATRRRRCVVIGLPFNDLRCLGSITEVIAELVAARGSR